MESLFSLKGRIALVTGGTRGIGASMALALAEAGADIVLAQRTGADTSTKKAIESIGRQCTIYNVDLSNTAEVGSLVQRVVGDGYDLSILLNCAGIQKRHPCKDFPDRDWNEVLQVNLSSVFTLCRDAGAYMLSRPMISDGLRGSIINIASLLSFQGGLTVPAYAASKGGIAQLTKALANEWACQGVHVNAIAPGYIDTDMNTALMNDSKRADAILARIPQGRWGRPEDFRGPVVFLASPAAAYINGEILTVDGGWMGR